MNRAVVVLLLLIANTIVSTSKIEPMPDPALPPRNDYSLGLLTIVDGATLAPERGRHSCAATGRLALSSSIDSAGETPACRAGAVPRAPALFDVRL